MKITKQSFILRLNNIFTILLLSFIAVFSLVSHSHEGHANKAPWEACEEKKLSDSCSYQTTSTLYLGSCRSIRSDLMCVRNQPLVKLKSVVADHSKVVEKVTLTEGVMTDTNEIKVN